MEQHLMEMTPYRKRGRWVWIDEGVTLPAPQQGRPRTPQYFIAQEMAVGESYFTQNIDDAETLRNSIRHIYGRGSAKMRKFPKRGWRVWREK
jgi:hypothetical protein